MDFSAKILADSCNFRGDRLVTFELTYPRSIHSEIMTHRVFSRNAASSRAIPVKKMISNITEKPFIPLYWGLNEKGMQSSTEATPEQIKRGTDVILNMRNACLTGVSELMEIGFHKQLANRYLEPWMWITVILSTTSFEHFRRLRVDAAAEPHFQKIAGMAADLYDSHLPKLLHPGEWHLPLVGFPGDDDFEIMDKVKLSTARCARVSYLTHDGLRDVTADFELHDRLSSSKHWSPFEHPAQALDTSEVQGNYVGFKQYRKFFADEFVPDIKR